MYVSAQLCLIIRLFKMHTNVFSIATVIIYRIIFIIIAPNLITSSLFIVLHRLRQHHHHRRLRLHVEATKDDTTETFKKA